MNRDGFLEHAPQSRACRAFYFIYTNRSVVNCSTANIQSQIKSLYNLGTKMLQNSSISVNKFISSNPYLTENISQLSNAWSMPNYVSKGFGPPMTKGLKKTTALKTCSWVSSWLPFTVAFKGFYRSGTSSGYGLCTRQFYIFGLASGCKSVQFGHTNRYILDPKESNERYGYPLSTGTL